MHARPEPIIHSDPEVSRRGAEAQRPLRPGYWGGFGNALIQFFFVFHFIQTQSGFGLTRGGLVVGGCWLTGKVG